MAANGYRSAVSVEPPPASDDSATPRPETAKSTRANHRPRRRNSPCPSSNSSANSRLPVISRKRSTLWCAGLKRASTIRCYEADAAGLTRPGILLATRPHALVTTPAAATVRYRGPLLDYGNVMILEPQAGLLLVLAGLDQVFGAPGEVLPAGSPVGLMGGQEPQAGTIVVQSGEGAGNTRSETLYIEVRENNQPVDPALWFAMQEG